MPKAGGLDDVTQKIGVDSTEAVKGYSDAADAAGKAEKANDSLLRSLGLMRDTTRNIGSEMDGLSRSIRDLTSDQRDAAQSAIDYNARVTAIAIANDKAAASFRKLHADIPMGTMFADMPAQVQQVTEQVTRLRSGYQDLATASASYRQTLQDVARVATASIQLEQTARKQAHDERMAQLYDQAKAEEKLSREIESQGQAITRSAAAAQAAVTAYATRQRTAAAGIIGSKGATLAGALGETQASGDSAAYQAVADTILAATSMRSNAGGAAPAGAVAGLAAAAARAATQGGGGAYAGWGGGGAGGYVPIMSRFPGGGGGGGGSFFGGLVGGLAGGGSFDFGGALRQYDATATFLKRWYSFAHYAIMGANEILATVGPAAVAGLAGAAVGLEGAQMVVSRVQAANAVGQSLGPSMGQTPGSLLGLGQSLQKAQTAADPQVFQLLGAAINSSGKLSDFWQLGTNTIHMVDEFAAHMTQLFQGNLGGQLQSLVSGGTGDLKQFGDVIGNVGTTFLHMAPALPGVGGDYLSILQGATKALSWTTGVIPQTALGGLLAAEAGGRLGGPIVGGTARLLGKIPGLGSVARAATANDIAAGTIGIAGKPVATVGETIAGEGLAGAVGATSLPTIAALAAAAYVGTKIVTAQTPGQQRIAGLQSQINQSNFTQGLNLLASGIGTAAPQSTGQQSVTGVQEFGRGLATEFVHGNLMLGVKEQLNAIFGGGTPTTAGSNASAVQQWASQFKDIQSTAQDIAKTFGVSLPEAFSLADQAGLQVGDNLDKKTGKLNATAKTMIANTLTGFAAMSSNTGALGTNIAAVQAMGGLNASKITQVNQSWDQLTALSQGGAAAASSLFGLLGGTPTASTKAKSAGINLTPPPAFSGFAKALGSFTSPTGAAAWNTLTNAQSGMFPALEQNTDWLRELQTMNGLAPGKVTSLAGYDIAQLLPILGKNPAALAMLSTYAQGFGGPSFAPGTSGSAMRSGLQKWIQSSGGLTNKQYNALMTQGSESLANVGLDANVFSQQLGTGSTGNALATGLSNYMSSLMTKFITVAGHTGTTGAIGNLVNAMAGSGTSLKGAQGMISYAAKLTGANPAQINAMMAQVKKDYNIYIKTHADTSGAKQAAAALAAIKSKDAKAQVNVQGASELKTLENSIAALKGKNVQAAAHVAGAGAVAALNAEIAALHSKEVTITTRMITIGGAMPGFPGIPAGVVNPKMYTAQTGGMVPGSGFGDIIPAMLEPGEAVIPRYLVPLIAPILAAHRVPGFGGVSQSSASHFAAGGVVPAGNSIAAQIAAVWKTLDKLYAEKDAGNKSVAAQIAAIWKNQLDPLYAQRDKAKSGGSASGSSSAAVNLAAAKNFSISLIGNIANALKTTSAASIANSLVNKITQEIAYAKSVSSSVKSGLNLGGMDLTQGSVLQQMQNYAASSKSFGTDLAKLRKGGLNKDLISQIVGAGPVQGDLLAQSILGSGIGGVNKVWRQIGGSANVIGAQAAMAQFGGTLAPNLRSGTFVGSGGVNINISVGGGGTGGLNLSDAQIKALVARIQAALLKQAKRNNKTGLQLTGKGA